MRNMFISAAWFNWMIAVALLTNVDAVFSLFNIHPLPGNQLFVHFFSVVVFAFGIAYYWISRDMTANSPLIKFGALAKMMLVGMGITDVLLGIVSWQILILLPVDLIYSILFIAALRNLPQLSSAEA